MSAENWRILSKTSVTTDQYIPVIGRLRIQLQSLFPSLATAGTGGEALYTSVSNKNQLNFKGIKSADTAKLTVTTLTSNIILTLIEAGIDLSSCDNSSSNFLSTVALASNVTGVLPFANGGTGLSTIAKGQLLYASAANTVAATAAMSTNGALAIGNATTGIPNITTLTGGTNVTITNGGGTIEISAALSALTGNLGVGIYNLDLDAASGSSWMSGNGTSEGVHVDATGYVAIGDDTPTLPTLAAQLSILGDATTAISIGNTANYKAHKIKAINNTAAAAGLELTVEGADGGTGNQTGGELALVGGGASGTGTGGNVNVRGGDDNGGTGSTGGVNLQTVKAGNPVTALSVDADNDVSITAGLLKFTGGADIRTGAGILSIGTMTSHIVTTGADAITLADGVHGQSKFIVMKTDGGDGTLTPANFANGTTITFNDVGDSVHLYFTNSSWHIMGSQGVTIA
jgi:hypothetical protein